MFFRLKSVATTNHAYMPFTLHIILLVFRKAGRKDQKFRLVLEPTMTPGVSGYSGYNVNIMCSYLLQTSMTDSI